jgi:hypothetical protein
MVAQYASILILAHKLSFAELGYLSVVSCQPLMIFPITRDK